MTVELDAVPDVVESVPSEDREVERVDHNGCSAPLKLRPSNVVSLKRVRDRVQERERRSRAFRGLGARGKTESSSRKTEEERAEARTWLPVYEEYEADRPRTRGDCENGPRPCPWVSCRHHLFLDIKQNTCSDSLVINFPDTAVEDMKQSCALDIAALGGSSLEETATLMNVTHERVRQIQLSGLVKLKRGGALGRLGQFVDDHQDREIALITNSRTYKPASEIEQVTDEDVADAKDAIEDSDTPDIQFLSNHPKAELAATTKAWRIYMRGSVDHGHHERLKGPRKTWSYVCK